MFIRVKSTPNSPRQSVQIVASVRQGDKVQQKILRHVGIAMNDAELVKLKEVGEFIKAQLEQAHQPQLFVAEQVTQQVIESKQRLEEQGDQNLPVNLNHLREVQRSIVGIHEVYGAIYQQLNFDSIWGRSKPMATRREVLKQITLARVAQPESKRSSVALLARDFGVRLNLNTVYKMMDSLDEATIQAVQDRAYQAASTLLGESLDVLFYDCTTLYFESFASDELRQKGFSKDHKAQETQVLLALLVTREGLPIGYEVFPGATFEGHTLIPVVNKLKQRYRLNRAVFVADKGLFNKNNLAALTQAGIEYVVGAKLKTQTKALTEKIVDLASYTPLTDDLQTLTIDQGQGQRLIISHSQTRARKDQHDRHQAIDTLHKKMAKSKQPKAYVGASGYKKYLTIPKTGTISLNQQAIEDSARWDGLHGVITNVKNENVADILSHYSGLWRIEESFRIQKHDLKVRPIYHWNEARIRAHLAIAFMSFCCVRHLEYRVALQYKKLSPEVIRRELTHVQVSLLEDKNTKARYAMPSSLSHHAEKIYKALGLTPKKTAYPVQ